MSADNPLIISRSVTRETIRKALRLFVGRGRRYSVKQLSNGTGVPDRLIECAMCDPESEDFRQLGTEHLLSIASFLGETFTNEWLSLARQGAFALPDDGLPSPGDVAAECADDTADIANAAADGRFDGADGPKLRLVGEREIERGMLLVKAGGAQS